MVQLRREFRNANRNYLEEEYNNIKESSFVKIVDENLKGKEAYGNLFAEDCFSDDGKSRNEE